MKILEISINNIRGIKHLKLIPNGENIVILGPNGAGKSAIVDAIDFLLTGKITRLTGAGTKGITMKKHGKHIDSKIVESFVEASIKIGGIDDVIDIKRNMSTPNQLEIDKQYAEQVEKIRGFAVQGHHVLMRRNVLKFIMAEASTRATEIQSLLNLSHIEEIRKCLVKVRKHKQDNEAKSESTLNRDKDALRNTAKLTEFNEVKLLEVINTNRSVFGGDKVKKLDHNTIMQGIKSLHDFRKENRINIDELERNIKNLRNIMTGSDNQLLVKHDEELRELLLELRTDTDLLKSYNKSELIKSGIDLIDESGSCPLCDTPWNEGELEDYLQTKLKSIIKSDIIKSQINLKRKTILSIVDGANSCLNSIQSIVSKGSAVGDLDVLTRWLKELTILHVALEKPLEMEYESGISVEKVKRLAAPSDSLVDIESILQSCLAKYPKLTPDQSAWELLLTLKENLKQYDNSLERNLKDHNIARISIQIYDKFIESRDEVLTSLYNDIRGRFVALYREVHGNDENKFGAIIKPDDAGILFNVEFYGRGYHSPQALHSEGHQDSMGVCLFLALTEKLAGGLLDLIVLDDVMMSVDSGHRRLLASVIKESFAEKQFVITTHDQIWANQLVKLGVIKNKNLVAFYNWSVDMGPQTELGVDVWDLIQKRLHKNDIQGAASELRRGLEDCFVHLCESLGAKLIFNFQLKYDLGDVLPAACGKYKKLLKRAKDSAQKNTRKDDFEMFDRIEKEFSSCFIKCQIEQWAINPNVHYTNWGNFTSEDFMPVVNAFKELCNQFFCKKCNGMISVLFANKLPHVIHCGCGEVNWHVQN